MRGVGWFSAARGRGPAAFFHSTDCTMQGTAGQGAPSMLKIPWCMREVKAGSPQHPEFTSDGEFGDDPDPRLRWP